MVRCEDISQGATLRNTRRLFGSVRHFMNPPSLAFLNGEASQTLAAPVSKRPLCLCSPQKAQRPKWGGSAGERVREKKSG